MCTRWIVQIHDKSFATKRVSRIKDNRVGSLLRHLVERWRWCRWGVVMGQTLLLHVAGKYWWKLWKYTNCLQFNCKVSTAKNIKSSWETNHRKRVELTWNGYARLSTQSTVDREHTRTSIIKFLILFEARKTTRTTYISFQRMFSLKRTEYEVHT